MRVIIAGSRNVAKRYTIDAIGRCHWAGFISCVISGTCRGPDTHGEEWAKENRITVERHPADWDTFGKAAGRIRNEEMARVAHGLIAVWDGKSKDTKDMIHKAERLGLRIYFEDLSFDCHRRPVLPKGKISDLWEQVEERAAIYEYMGGVNRKQAEKLAGHNWRKGPAV